MNHIEIEKKVNDFFNNLHGKFQPFAVYNQSLDYIRVQTMDCSITEIPLNETLSVLQNTHGKETVVGFIVKSAKLFCKHNNLPISGQLNLEELLLHLEKHFPNLDLQSIALLLNQLSNPILVW